MRCRKPPDLSYSYTSRLSKILFSDDVIFLSSGLSNEFGVTMSSRAEKGLLSIRNCRNFLKDVRKLELSSFLIAQLYEECCEGEETCVRSQFPCLVRRLEEVGGEVDDLQWKFKLLAGHHVDSVSEQNARFIFQVKHGEEFGEIVFENFLTGRQQRFRVSWPEIEKSIYSLSPELELIREILLEREPSSSSSLTSPLRFDPFSEHLESPSTESLLEDLRGAMASCNSELVDFCLQKLKQQSVSNKLTRSAEQLLLSIRLSQDLRSVMACRDQRKIRVVLDRIRSSSLFSKLSLLYADAEALLHRLGQLEHLKNDVIDLSSASLSEIRSYSTPPSVIHSVVKSFLLLLSSPERELQTWEQCLAQLGGTGRGSVRRRVGEYQLSRVEKSTARRAKLLVARLSLESVMGVSTVCVVIFKWVQAVLGEVLDKE